MPAKIQTTMVTFVTAVIMFRLILVTSSNLDGRQKILCGNESIHPMTLRYLGAVDGKGYFVEANTTMTWQSAQTYCNASGLYLASIDTDREAYFINETLVPYGLQNEYWTGLHEKQMTPPMMEWDDSRKEPDTSFFYWSLSLVTNQYCGALGFIPPQIRVDVIDCALSRRVLCQSNFTKY